MFLLQKGVITNEKREKKEYINIREKILAITMVLIRLSLEIGVRDQVRQTMKKRGIKKAKQQLNFASNHF